MDFDDVYLRAYMLEDVYRLKSFTERWKFHSLHDGCEDVNEIYDNSKFKQTDLYHKWIINPIFLNYFMTYFINFCHDSWLKSINQFF